MSDPLFLGFDPGGIHRFGVALLSGRSLTTAHVSSIEEAVCWTQCRLGDGVPFAAGIDTLLHWSTAKSGWREADLRLRASYPSVAGSVMAPASLYGAMVFGGVALAIRLRQLWPNILLNETHPKVVYSAVFGARYPRASSQFDLTPMSIDGTLTNEDEFDALLSAWVTRQAVREAWPDIVGGGASLVFPISDVHYRWPVQL